MSYAQQEKKDFQTLKDTRSKNIAVPNYRCKECRKFDSLYSQFIKAYCRDCTRYAKSFIWYVILDLIIDVRRLKKDLIKVHHEGVFVFEQFSELRDSKTRNPSPSPLYREIPLDEKTNCPLIVL